MKSNTHRYPKDRHLRRFLAGLTCLGLGSYALYAQDDSAEDDVFELSPFVVDASEDVGYVTNASLSGSRFSQNLDDIPASISVMTAEMMDDLGVYDLQEAMSWQAGAIASESYDMESAPTSGISNEERRNTTISVRGADVSTGKNFFQSGTNSDKYNVERIDSSRGPNGTLFGASDLGGINNITTKKAYFRDKTSVNFSWDSYGGGRVSVDMNRPIIDDKFALRLNALYQDTDSWIDYGSVKQNAVTLAGSWKVNDSLIVRFETEQSIRKSVSPRSAIRDSTSTWNHFTTALSTLPGKQAVRNRENNANGVAGMGVDQYIIDVTRMDAGMHNWAGQVISKGGNATIAPVVLDDLFPGTEYVGMGVTETTTLVTDPDQAFLSALLTPGWDYGNLQMAGLVDSRAKSHSLTIEKRFSDNLFAEFGYNKTDETRDWTAQNGANFIKYDLAEFLPSYQLKDENGELMVDGNGDPVMYQHTIDGSPNNPNFLKPYMDTQPGARTADSFSEEMRALVGYQIKKEWFDLQLGFSVGYQNTVNEQFLYNLTITNGANPDKTAVENKPRFRSYLGDPQDGVIKFLRGNKYTVGPYEMEFFNTAAGAATKSESEFKSMTFFTAGSWGKERRLRTTLGVRRDDYSFKAFNDHQYDPVTQLYTHSLLDSELSNVVTSPSTGAVYHLTENISFYGNASKSFKIRQKSQLDYLGGVPPTPVGESVEYGVRFRFGKKLKVALSTYDTKQTDKQILDKATNNALGPLYDLMGKERLGVRYETQSTTASGYEMQVVGSPTKSWTLTGNLSFPENASDDTFGHVWDEFYAANIDEWEAFVANDITGEAEGRLDTIKSRAEIRRQNDGENSKTNYKMIGSFLTRYSFRDGKLKGLALTAGVKYRSDRALAENSTTGELYYIDETFEPTVGARYSWKGDKRKYNLNVSIKNPLDQLNFRWSRLSGTGVGQNFRILTPRNIRASLTVDF